MACEKSEYHRPYDNKQYPSLLFLYQYNIFFALHSHLHPAVPNSAVKLSHSLALTCCAESIGILYYNIILAVNSFFTNKSVEQIIIVNCSQTVRIMNSGSVTISVVPNMSYSILPSLTEGLSISITITNFTNLFFSHNTLESIHVMIFPY